jgi:hypothetical protein
MSRVIDSRLIGCRPIAGTKRDSRELRPAANDNSSAVMELQSILQGAASARGLVPCTPPRRAINPMRLILSSVTEASPSPALTALDSSISQIVARTTPSCQQRDADLAVGVLAAPPQHKGGLLAAAAAAASTAGALQRDLCNELPWPGRSRSCTPSPGPGSSRRLSFSSSSERLHWPLLNAFH